MQPSGWLASIKLSMSSLHYSYHQNLFEIIPIATSCFDVFHWDFKEKENIYF